MSWSNRFYPRFLIGFALMLSLVACGFQPLYKQDSQARDLHGQIQIPERNNRNDFEFRESLLLRLGQQNSPQFQMSYTLRITEENLVVIGNIDTVRFLLTGHLTYRITDLTTGATLFRDSQSNTVSYSATGATFPTRRAKESANTRLIEGLAEQAYSRLSITAQDWWQ
ncbi:MAG: hypothetical protein K8953_07520 [Proteobacteria bacterium]|nr:hypothetical protein [Pseudomonadota bacterium]